LRLALAAALVMNPAAPFWPPGEFLTAVFAIDAGMVSASLNVRCVAVNLRRSEIDVGDQQHVVALEALRFARIVEFRRSDSWPAEDEVGRRFATRTRIDVRRNARAD